MYTKIDMIKKSESRTNEVCNIGPYYLANSRM